MYEGGNKFEELIASLWETIGHSVGLLEVKLSQKNEA